MIVSSDELALDAVLTRHEKRLTCQFGMNESSSSLHDAYQGMSARNAGRLGRQQIGPLNQYLGFGPQAGSARADRMDARLQGATGPLADFIRQARAFVPGVYDQSQQVGNQVAGEGQNAYNMFQSQLGAGLGDVSHAADLARHYADRASQPIANEDLYQTAQRRVLQQLRPELAARGLEGASGAGAQATSDALRNLTLDYANQQRQDQYQSLQPLQQTAQLRTGLAGSGMDAVGQLAQMLSAQWGIPLQAFGGVLNLLTAGQQPGLALTQATAPQMGQSSSGWRLL